MSRNSDLALGLLRTARPRQWLKNVLVLAAPVMSGQVVEAPVLRATAIAFAAFVLASSGIYFVNDARDAPLDRQHPVKRRRPVAAGIVRPRPAYAVGALLIVAAGALAAAASTALVVVVGLYAAISLAYCFWLKHEPIVDLAAVAAGFLLRTIAGGAASGIELSQWFLLAASFGSLFVAAGKRYAEIRDESIVAGSTRTSLTRYSATYLRFVWTMSVAVLFITYGLWAFEESERFRSELPVYSIAPFTLAVLRYALHVDAAGGAEPEEIFLKDGWLLGLGLVWAVLIGATVFA